MKPEIVRGTDFVILRENCGGAYFGPKVEYTGPDCNEASDTWLYTRPEIERCARVAGALARQSKDPKTGTATPCNKSADKANVLASSRLWRAVVSDVFVTEFPDVPLKHQLADSLALLMVKSPTSFNGIVLADNTFGDMLSDEAGALVGTLGILPSASLCGIPEDPSTSELRNPGSGGRQKFKRTNGIYEPVHGSAPDISGKGIVNPLAQILSAAMMLRYSFGMEAEADAIEKACERVLDDVEDGGYAVRAGDLGGKATTVEVGDAVCKALREILGGKVDSANGQAK